jgi:tryptophan 2,3-dioxygenase
MQNIHEPVYYGDYLELGKLLDTQHPKSKEIGNEAHDETLFIIVHQVYELWFKQIIHELKSIKKIFSQPTIDEGQLSTIVERLKRIKKIQPLFLQQLDIMETMTPMDFLEFRDLLVPASGHQSVQFREIEIMMGLKTDQRKSVDREYFLGRLSDEDKQRIIDIEKEDTLAELIQRWLERMPFTFTDKFDFWSEYKACVDDMLCGDEITVTQNQATLPPKALEMAKANNEATRRTFETLFDKEKFDALLAKGDRKFSQKATLSALFILLYRNEPILHLPYLILESLLEIDEHFTTWRYRHSMMAHRMLGTKIGTGGTSGHEYLKMAAENNRAFLDLFNLSTFLIPRSKLPVLPKEVKDKMNFKQV